MEVQLIGGTPTGVADAVVADLTTRAKQCRGGGGQPRHWTWTRPRASRPSPLQPRRPQRLLGIMVPKALGGEGASISDVADVCYQLGQACASTGMIYAMHQIKIACVMRHMGDNAALQQHAAAAVRRAAAARLLDHRGPGRRQHPLERSADRTPRGRPHQPRAQGERHLLRCVRGRRRDHGAARGRCRARPIRCWWRFFKSDYTLTRLQGWNALGMRGTCSEGYTLKANAAADQILPEPYETIHAAHHGALRAPAVGLGVDRHRRERHRARAGLHPQRHAPQQRSAAARGAAVHQGDGDAAHAARHAGDLAAHVRAASWTIRRRWRASISRP